jgi:hypothetical protein
MINRLKPLNYGDGFKELEELPALPYSSKQLWKPIKASKIFSMQFSKGYLPINKGQT